MPDNPWVRIEMSGLRGAGKSVLAALFRELLAGYEVAAAGPDLLPLRSERDLRAAIGNLRKRGLSVTFVETQTGVPPQIDARGRR